jgi:hypothetical protein
MNKKITAAAKLHVSGTRSDGFDPAPADAYQWPVESLPKVAGKTTDEIRAMLAAEIKRIIK